MLKVIIAVNFTTIAEYTAQRVKGGTRANEINSYLLDSGKVIKHRYGDGALTLARKILQHAKEPK